MKTRNRNRQQAIRAAAVARQCKRRGRGAVEYLDNRGSRSARVFQRMAVMAVDNYDNQEDALVWNNLEFALQQAPGELGDLQSHKVWNRLHDDEEIRIVEHGEKQKVGGKNAAQIASSMTTDGNTLDPNVSIGGITFQSCYAGVSGGQGSLVSDMRDELRRMNRFGVPVKGRNGIAFGFKGMGEATAETGATSWLKAYKWRDPAAKAEYDNLFNYHREYGLEAYCEAMWELKDAKTKVSNADIFNRPFVFCGYNQPHVLVGLSEVNWQALTPQQKAERVAAEMEDYWGQIKTKMERKNVKAFKKFFALTTKKS